MPQQGLRLHSSYGMWDSSGIPPISAVFQDKDFVFYKENPLGGTRICNACALNIQGFLYQCSRGDVDLHPCCANLPPVFSLPDTNMEIRLSKEIKSKCLKCQTKKRQEDKVQGLAYVYSNGSFCYHVACLKEAYFKLDVIANDENKSLALQNLAPKEVALRRDQGQSSKAMKRVKWLIIFLKLVVQLYSESHLL
ncbi:hypothetical protein PTKIN_Ptkin16aG0508600 [Pterospermum kingtungense]